MRFLAIAQNHPHLHRLVRQPRRIDTHGDKIQQHRCWRRCQHIRTEGVDRTCHHAFRQLLGTGQVDIAPGTRLGLVTQLRVHLGQQGAGGFLFTTTEYQVIEQCRRPAIVACIDGRASICQHLGLPSHRRHITSPFRFRGIRVEIRGVRVIPAHVTLVHGLAVMAHRAVVPTVEPLPGEHLWQLQMFGDFPRSEARVHQSHRLVMQVLIGIAVQAQEFRYTVAAVSG